MKPVKDYKQPPNEWCRVCGNRWTGRLEFCPNCGRRTDRPRSAWRTFAIVVTSTFAVLLACGGSCLLLLSANDAADLIKRSIAIGIAGFLALCALITYWAMRRLK